VVAARPAASSSPTTPTRSATTPGTSSGMDIKGHVVRTALDRERLRHQPRSTTPSFTLDRRPRSTSACSRPQGGVEIEEVAADRTRRHRQDLHIDPVDRPHRRRRAASGSQAAKLDPAAQPTARSTSS
jgi:succinyl-CoA synthetase beta subunit